ncbi:MAG: PLP-dependent transferase [Clostridia bacterium]|nr:PLP-dependent transferase [Clostridia bacterium]
MNTPICDFVKKYAETNTLRLHMPGHKGEGLLGVEHLDITEIDGADTLYSADGIIKQSQENASILFGSKNTYYSCEGSSLCIRAMLYLALLYAKKNSLPNKILALRNVHKSFVSGIGLLDLDVEWYFGKNPSNYLSCSVSPEDLDAYLSESAELPVAFYVTSPDYLGNMLDISGISKVCKKHGVLLLVDNAHGAYLKFLDASCHPIEIGADLCCDSAHKTLPALTGCAYLHVSSSAPSFLSENAENALSLFASTSPSYLLLQSLDRLNSILDTDLFKMQLQSTANKINRLKERLTDKGYKLVGNEKLKLTVNAKEYGFSGFELAKILKQNEIVSEFADPDFVVLMFSYKASDYQLNKLSEVLLSLEKRTIDGKKIPAVSPCETVCSIKDAISAVSEPISAQYSCGRVLATLSVSCPPAVPFIVCGERISAETVKLFEYYGINECRVIIE